ncbi:hypothetical protein LUZ60_008401 [Juncus effusus]|nr:hypothetical protein LUZ60_008401 [Juncus effusus]
MPGMPSDSTSILPFSLESSAHQQPPIYPLQHRLSSPLSRIHVSWSRGNVLHVTCLRPPPPAEEQEEEDESMDGDGVEEEEEVGGMAVEVILGGAMLEGEIREEKKRRIAYESLKSFAFLNDKKMSLAKMEETDMNAPSRTYWWQYALQYSRSINDLLSNPRSPESLIQDPRIFLKEGEESSATKGAWELMEIFYVDIQLLSWLPERLVDWLEDYDSRLLSGTESTVHSKLANLQRKLAKLQIVEDDSDYWSGLASALSVGWLHVVVKLLKLHGSYDLDQMDNRETENGLVEAVSRLITEMPRMRSDNNTPDEKLGVFYQTKQDYIKGLEEWRGKVSGLESTSFWLQCEHRKTRDGLKSLLQIMLGNLRIIVDSTFNWVELLISHLIYIRPLTNGLEGLNNLAEKCMQLKPSSNNNGLAGLLIAIISENPEVVLADCLKTFGPWIVAHAVDLLTSNNEYIDAVLNEERYNLGGTSIGEIYVLVYAQALASHSLTWQVAPAYLSCLNQGPGLLEVLLLSQPVQNYRSVLKTLEICHLYELSNISPQIMRNAGMNQWKHGNKALAIHWFKQSRDKTILSRIAQQLFDFVGNSLSDQSFKQLEGLMELLGSDIGTAGGLDFLHKYRDFKKALQQIIEGGETDATRKITELLIQLMKNPSTPQRFWLPLLHDSVKLLEWKDRPILNVSDTNLLLGKLQELSMAKLRHELQEFAIGPNALASIRLALAKNLGRAILQES